MFFSWSLNTFKTPSNSTFQKSKVYKPTYLYNAEACLYTTATGLYAAATGLYATATVSYSAATSLYIYAVGLHCEWKLKVSLNLYYQVTDILESSIILT